VGLNFAGFGIRAYCGGERAKASGHCIKVNPSTGKCQTAPLPGDYYFGAGKWIHRKLHFPLPPDPHAGNVGDVSLAVQRSYRLARSAEG
jgi:hypothetical protein